MSTEYESPVHDGKAPLHLRVDGDLKLRMDEVVPRGRRNELFEAFLEDILPLLEDPEVGPALLGAFYQRRLKSTQIVREAKQHGHTKQHEAKLPRANTGGEAGLGSSASDG